MDCVGYDKATSQWAGIRPGTPDAIPIIGLADTCSNLIIATRTITKDSPRDPDRKDTLRFGLQRK